MKILFLCVANSARSQIAEGLARKILGSKAEIQSAGSHPSGKVHPLAIQVLEEVGIDMAKHFSKATSELPEEFMKSLNYAITLCAEEVCPVLNTSAKKLHWGMPDPAALSDQGSEKLQAFRQVRDAIKKKIVAELSPDQ